MKVRIGIFFMSLALCAALFWGGAALVALMMEWLAGHPWVAKAMVALPMLPFVAILLSYQRRREPLSD